MRGVYGQSIYVDPELKLVLVHTAVAKTASIGNEPMGAELGALWLGLVNTFGALVGVRTLAMSPARYLW
jgi:hypothetical protein